MGRSAMSEGPGRWSALAASAPERGWYCCWGAMTMIPADGRGGRAVGVGALSRRLRYANAAERVVQGEKLMQASSDILLVIAKCRP